MLRATNSSLDKMPASPASARTSRSAAKFEFFTLVLGVLAIMWIAPFTPQPRLTARIIIGFLIALLLFGTWRERPGFRAVGLRLDNFFPVLGRVLVYVGGLVIVVVSIGLMADSLRLGRRFWTIFLGVPVWALLQQYLLLGFAHRRLRVILGSGRPAVLATTAVFGVMHLPNPTLALVCALGGFVWAREYDRSPNLFAHALSHGVGSAFLANSLPPELLKNMVVGYRYLLT
jgi:membrane protease YdiL (CAAX protease family)